ncbi:MAG TPA: anthranilate synthase component I family protein [Panacibacter sp.]|nr:anthranilate synthase component I family protein [Panacibacter sp.]HNP42989.1 anthranilate synthase component I family protein [Panacibacter sp.]
MDNNQYQGSYHSYEWLLAVDTLSIFSEKENILESMQQYCNNHHDWLFGHLGYDLKNEIESLTSGHNDFIKYPAVFLFQPVTVISLKDNCVTISTTLNSPLHIFTEVTNVEVPKHPPQGEAIIINSRFSRQKYIDTVEKLREHILRGDCYEINFCMEFFAENVSLSPLFIYRQLMLLSPNPFSCFYKLNDKYLVCASPERYVRKSGSAIVSQPVKGTIRRNTLADEDLLNRRQLQQSEKERSENVMVVDLVRNDLSKICKQGSVKVDELFGIYSFPQLHQMISTVSGELKEDTDFAAIIKATFPMGSMTGAPKKRVMELVEQYEKTKRGIFSGSVGYITPDADFDFNVVIRSIMYNECDKYLSYQVGSGITFNSNPSEEYNECLLKAKAIEEVLKNSKK